MRETQTKSTVLTGNHRILGALAATLLSLLCSFWASVATADGSHTDALVRYYVAIAREAFHKQDVRLTDEPFTVTVVVRRFTLNSNADTLQLDTAIVRAYLTPDASLPDTLNPDSVVVLRSSYLDDEPSLPALFTRPAWDGDFIYSLFPNDPGKGEIAVGYDSRDAKGGLSVVGTSGLITLDRSTGSLRYEALMVRADDNITRYTRETSYSTVEGYLMPKKIVERISRIGVWGNQYEIKEVSFLKLRLGGNN